MYYIITINIITLMAYIIDKFKAKRHAWRIPEAALLGLATIGGSVGALIGVFIIRHKSRRISNLSLACNYFCSPNRCIHLYLYPFETLTRDKLQSIPHT